MKPERALLRSRLQRSKFATLNQLRRSEDAELYLVKDLSIAVANRYFFVSKTTVQRNIPNHMCWGALTDEWGCVNSYLPEQTGGWKMKTQSENDANDIDLKDYGDAVKETKQASPYPLFFDSIYQVGARDWKA